MSPSLVNLGVKLRNFHSPLSLMVTASSVTMSALGSLFLQYLPYQTTRYHYPEDHNLNFHFCGDVTCISLCLHLHLFLGKEIWRRRNIKDCIGIGRHNTHNPQHVCPTEVISLLCGSTAPLLDLGRFFSFLILYTVGRIPWTGIRPSQGRYLHTDYTHTDIHSSSGIRTQDPSVRAGEDGLCFRPRGHCDRPFLEYLGCITLNQISVSVNIMK
jgi:hypothetical protein